LVKSKSLRDLKETVKKEQRNIKHSVRDIEKEERNLQREEQKLVADIKKAAKQGQSKAALATLAKSLVGVRKQQAQLMVIASRQKAVSSQLTQVVTQATVAGVMKNTVKTMQKVNDQVKLPELQKTVKNFARESEKMEMAQEMMGDALNMDGDEEESDELVSQVMDEIGLSQTAGMVDVSKKNRQSVEVDEKEIEDKELEARLAALSKN